MIELRMQLPKDREGFLVWNTGSYPDLCTLFWDVDLFLDEVRIGIWVDLQLSVDGEGKDETNLYWNLQRYTLFPSSVLSASFFLPPFPFSFLLSSIFSSSLIWFHSVSFSKSHWQYSSPGYDDIHNLIHCYCYSIFSTCGGFWIIGLVVISKQLYLLRTWCHSVMKLICQTCFVQVKFASVPQVLDGAKDGFTLTSNLLTANSSILDVILMGFYDVIELLNCSFLYLLCGTNSCSCNVTSTGRSYRSFTCTLEIHLPSNTSIRQVMEKLPRRPVSLFFVMLLVGFSSLDKLLLYLGSYKPP